ncbi:unnamed protein product [Malus baccata var. baccata]
MDVIYVNDSNHRKPLSNSMGNPRRKGLSRYLIFECLFFVIFGVCNLEAYANNRQKGFSHYLISECLFFAIFGICNLETYANKFDGWIVETSFIPYVSHQNDTFTNTSSFIYTFIKYNIRFCFSRYLISECLFFAIFGVCNLEAYANKFDGWIVETSFVPYVSHQNDTFTNTSSFIYTFIKYNIRFCAYTNKFDGWIVETSFVQYVSIKTIYSLTLRVLFILSISIT